MHKSIVTHDGRRRLGNVPGQDSRRARLLVADDNETNRRLMSIVLAPVDALVTFAVDGVEAVRAAAETSFDLILMDIQMPHMDGLEATRRIREAEASRCARRTPIFAVTASAMQYDGDQYHAAGMDRVICKPIDVSALLTAVSDVMALIEFRFVGVDASGRWREVRYAAFKDEIAARTFDVHFCANSRRCSSIKATGRSGSWPRSPDKIRRPRHRGIIDPQHAILRQAIDQGLAGLAPKQIMAFDPKISFDQPLARPSAEALNRLLTTLEVKVVWLSECLVTPGWRMELPSHAALGIHYTLMGEGWLKFESEPAIPIRPHTLIVLPPSRRFSLGVDAPPPLAGPLHVQDYRGSDVENAAGAPVQVRRRVAGAAPKLMVICGYFEAVFGATIDLFSGLTSPIVEQFDTGDQIDMALRHALNELVTQEIGDGAMAAAMLKQVMVRLLRRSLSSSSAWVERFSVMSDRQITRAFLDMVERPGAPHTVQSLAKTAGLSRSAFMDRFRNVFSKTPMAALRDLRMRQAARALVAGQASLEQITYDAGYQDRTGFLRAFRKVYGCDPAEFRSLVHKDDLFIGL